MSVNEIVAQAYLYVDRGWAVIPLREGGMLPAEGDWPNRGARSRPGVDAAWQINPGANLGIITGRLSGFWVLDIDPGNGGEQALAGLIQAYGRLPETYTVATPSGGTHYYFLMPADFEPRNAQHGRRAGRLPVGIDVRGWHGYVAAPPTARGATAGKVAGRYQVLTDFPLSPAPEWLLDMIRPVEQVERADAGPVDWAPAMGAVGGPDRERALVGRALPEELGELAAARPGARNETAFRVASRLWEFINAGWLAGRETWALFAAAGRLADVDGTFGEAELAAVWGSARRKVAGKVATLDDTGYYGSAVSFEALGVTAAGFSAPGTAVGGQAATPVAAAVPGLTFVDPATVDEASSAQAVEAAPDPVDPQAELRERLIGAELGRLWVREQAAKRLKAMGARPRNWAAEILDEDGLAMITPPVPLVADWLFTDSLARINGPSGHGKSFVALELAACVSTGRGWHRKVVTRGTVVYVAAEGASGVRQRLEAWKTRNEVDRHGLLVLPAPVQVTEAEWDSFVEHMRALRPAMVVLDTQARVTVGVDENSATEMGEFVDGLERLRAATGACVLVVHHRGLKGSEGRGSTAVKGAVATEMDVSRTGTKVLISCRKQKDAPEAESIQTQLVMIDPNDPTKSAVLVAAGDSYSSSEGLPVFVNPSLQDVAKMRLLALISVLRDQFGMGNGGTRAEIKAAFQAHPDIQGLTSEVQRRAWNRSWGKLEDLGRIARNPLAERFKFAEIDDLDDCAENPDNYSEFGWPIAKRNETTT